MYKQCRKDSKYKGELIKEKGESALYTPQTHTNPVTPPTAVTPLGITAVDCDKTYRILLWCVLVICLPYSWEI